MTDEERYREALEELAVLGGGRSEGNAIAQAALNPRPVTEEVEVKRWAVVDSNGHFKESIHYDTKPDAEYMDENWPGCQLVVSTYHYSRPVKRKVKRHGTYGGAIYADGILKVNDCCNEIPVGKPLILKIEWEEDV